MLGEDFHNFVKANKNHKDALILFEDEKGSHPNLWVIGYFLFLVTAMAFNLYNFAKFQKY